MRTALKKAAIQISRANSVVIAGHVNPDGDSIGSGLALAHALMHQGKHVVLLSHHGVPEIYRWMPGHEIVRQSTDERGFDLAIVADTGTVDRIGSAQDAVLSAHDSLCIDHHVAEGTFGNLRLVRSTASATGEIIYALLKSMGAEIDRSIADCLLCAIVTDTGGYRFRNVTPTTLRISASLMQLGASPAEISELVFENRSFSALKILGRALDNLRVTADGNLAWSALSATDFADMNATDEDTEGIVNHVLAVRGVKVGLLFREIPGKKVRISLRSRNGYDVNRVAQAFGGGGHRLAAGCTLDPPLEQAVEVVIAEAARWME